MRDDMVDEHTDGVFGRFNKAVRRDMTPGWTGVRFWFFSNEESDPRSMRVRKTNKQKPSHRELRGVIGRGLEVGIPEGIGGGVGIG